MLFFVVLRRSCMVSRRGWFGWNIFDDHVVYPGTSYCFSSLRGDPAIILLRVRARGRCILPGDIMVMFMLCTRYRLLLCLAFFVALLPSWTQRFVFCCVCFVFLHLIYPRPSFLPPSRNPNPGSHSRLFPPLPTTVRALHFYRESLQPLRLGVV